MELLPFCASVRAGELMDGQKKAAGYFVICATHPGLSLAGLAALAFLRISCALALRKH